MATSITMPQLGESVTEGTIGRWLKAVGERVERDEALVEVITDKVNVELPSPEAGVLARISVEEGQTVPVGTEICQLESGSDAGARPASAGASVSNPENASGGAPSAVREAEPAGVSAETGGPTPATPGGAESETPPAAPAGAAPAAGAGGGAGRGGART